MALSLLPIELLQQIADCLQAAHTPSLHAFSLTSKICHTACSVLIFRHISITASNREALQRDVNKLTKALHRTDSARHIQCLSIKGALQLNTKKKKENGIQSALGLKSLNDDGSLFNDLLQKHGLDEILVDEEPIHFSDFYMVYDEPVIKKSSEEDIAWAPVVSLLQMIPYLRDLVYDCRNQFPPSLLSTLRHDHPQCRLHHLTFRFRTLLWGVPYPYEMELATYPSLHRLKVYCSERDSDGDDDFNQEAIMDLAAGLAPNLKDVTILNLFPSLSGRYFRARQSFKGLPGSSSESIGSLTSLSLRGCSSLKSPTELSAWAARTDFTCLQHLYLGGGCENQSNALNGETMEWVSQNLSFPQMKTLSVYLTRDDAFHAKPRYSDHAVAFFHSFGSLEELAIHGPIDSQIVDAILSQHGHGLRKLNLHPFEEAFNYGNGRERRDIPMEFTIDCIQQIQAQCPILEDLTIPIKRDKSSASETALYRCFSDMKSLRFLLLNLNCSNWRVFRDDSYDVVFDGEDDEEWVDRGDRLKRGHMKETLINCAVDEALARGIWKTINNNKRGTRLERLKLWTSGGGQYGGRFGVGTLHNILQYLSRSWHIEPVTRDDREDIIVRELGRHVREVVDSGAEHFEQSEFGQVLRSIWPRKEGSKDWRDDWSSFPLSG